MSNRQLLNRADPAALATIAGQMKLGDVVAQNLVKHIRNADPDAPAASSYPYDLSSLDVLVLPDTAKACTILRATGRAGVTGEFVVDAYGTTPATGHCAVTPNGNIAFNAATDTVTDVDVVYTTEAGIVIEYTGPVVSNDLTLPDSIVDKGVVLLLEAESLEGTLVSKMIVLVPGGAPATTKANLDLPKALVHFAVADAVTRARVKLLVAAPVSVADFLEADETTV